jgi:hypothetical protein
MSSCATASSQAWTDGNPYVLLVYPKNLVQRRDNTHPNVIVHLVVMVRRLSVTGSKLFTDISRLAIDHALRWQKFGIERLVVIVLVRGLLLHFDRAMGVGRVVPSRSGRESLCIVSISEKFGRGGDYIYQSVIVYLIVIVRRLLTTGSQLFTNLSRFAKDHALRCQNFRTKWLVSIAIIRGLLVYIDGAMLVVVSGGVLPSRGGWYPLCIVSISDKFGQRRYNTHANVFVHLIVMARRLLDAGCQFFTYLPRLAINHALRCQNFGIQRLGIIVSVCGLQVHINVAMLATVSCSALRCRGRWEPLWIC